MSTKALEALLQKFQVVVFVGGFSQSGSTTCEGSHGTEDVDVLVLALHLCRISAAMSTDKGKLKNKSKNIKEIYHDIFTYIILHNIFDIPYQPCFFSQKVAELHGAISPRCDRPFGACGGLRGTAAAPADAE